MAALFLTITPASLNQAITDLSIKMGDLEGGTQKATLHFEKLIGAEQFPNLSREDRIALLSDVRDELERAVAKVENEESPSEDLSDAAILVLCSYKGANERPKLEVPHQVWGPGIPTAQMTWAATMLKAKLSLVLRAISEERDPPAEHFHSYFEAYANHVGMETYEDEGELWFATVTIAYLDALLDSPEDAWAGKIEVPVMLLDHALAAYLEHAKAAVRLH